VQRLCFGIVLLALAFTPAAFGEAPWTMVACAPGYPGNSEQAQPSMDAFAQGVALASGWTAGRLNAVYHEKLEPGLARLGESDAVLALVPLPFYLAYRKQLELDPVLRVSQTEADSEQWSLIARRGSLAGPGSLADWQLYGMAGYVPEFVRHVALSEWGELPDAVDIRFTARILSKLRTAAQPEQQVAVLLDSSQTAALDSLPFAGDLEVVASSEPMIGALLCRIGDRISEADTATLAAALLQLHRSESGRELLAQVRVREFQPLDREALAGIEVVFDN